jgi:Ca-activated chloride channel family protein
MKRNLAGSLLITAGTFLLSYFILAKFTTSDRSGTVEAASKVTQGALQIIDKDGKPGGQCPLKHTNVKAEISGSLARVTVTQEFHNPLREKIEAVYAFPLPQNAAVDDMTMIVGDRTVKGKIKRREEARMIYEAAREAGHVAGLLDQERPNIFTQSVANITPDATVKVTISYVEVLSYEDGTYQFVFPMVVGPRYIPGEPIGGQGAQSGGGWAPDTSQVPDASRITPPVTSEGTRAGHDISIDVALDAGVPIDSLTSTLHEVDVEKPDNHRALVRLKDRATIPNKDFILKFDVAGRKIEDAILTHRSRQGGFFTMILQPPERVTALDVTPKELVFVIDTSGSMMGFPIEKAKETMKRALDGLYPQDTFNLITFSGDTHILFPQPVPATRENLRRAQDFLASRQGSGGTEMMKAIRAALDPSDKQYHVRVVCFMTDGYVGNDFEIIDEVKKHTNARVFSFGIGQSVNRFLLDNMARHGRGEVEYVTLQDDGSAAAKRFHERVRSPLLTDISIDWGGLPVADLYPQQIPDLFSAKPVVLSGRYTAGARGMIRVRGKMAGRDFVREIPVDLPESQPQHDVLATLWARTRIDDLMSQDYSGLQRGTMKPEVKEAITQLGLEYRLMTQFTSFVAVEETIVTEGGQPRRIDVPVEMPEGVSYEGVFGKNEQRHIGASAKRAQPLMAPQIAATPMPSSSADSATQSVIVREKNQAPRAGSGSGKGAGQGRGASVSGGNLALGGGSVSPSPEDEKQRQLLSKLHPSISAVIERLKNKQTQPTAEEAKFVRDGKAEIQIWLADKSAGTMEQLRKLGFEVILNPQSSKLIIGRLPIEKLASLAELAAVKYIAPQTK